MRPKKNGINSVRFLPYLALAVISLENCLSLATSEHMFLQGYSRHSHLKGLPRFTNCWNILSSSLESLTFFSAAPRSSAPKTDLSLSLFQSLSFSSYISQIIVLVLILSLFSSYISCILSLFSFYISCIIILVLILSLILTVHLSHFLSHFHRTSLPFSLFSPYISRILSLLIVHLSHSLSRLTLHLSHYHPISHSLSNSHPVSLTLSLCLPLTQITWFELLLIPSSLFLSP
jgi:hypothetical protein